MDCTTPLPPRLETVRRVVLLINEVGVRCTAAVDDAGLGELSGNSTITTLTRLAHDGPLRPRDLLGATKLTRGGLSNLFDRLEATGYIERTYGAVPGDRRGAMVEITAKGREAVDTIDEATRAAMAQLGPTLAAAAAAISSLDTQAEDARSDTPVVPRLELFTRAGSAMVAAAGKVDRRDPTPGTTAVVLSSAAQPGHTRPNELADRTGLTSSGVSQLLQRLEDGGLVERKPGVDDRRAVIVALTTKGRAQLERQLTAMAEHLSMLTDAIEHPDSTHEAGAATHSG